MDARYAVVQASAGEGGYGRIDKAMDTTLERHVAIKTLDPLFKSAPSDEDVERFRREAKTLAQLSHPNVPAIYYVQFSPEANEFRIIFEWVEGQTLREYLQDRGVLSLEEARLYFSQICSALSHAHEHGIVHRDIKPANVILTTDAASCYLVDFGIALREVDLVRVSGTAPVGTPGYMSPEQERGEEVTAVSDVCSLGILLYECLAGSRPVVGGYKALSLHNEAIPPGIDALIQSALSDVPARRPPTPRQFMERLGATLQPHSTFTSTLADGSLHEIQLALNKMHSTDFAALPPGQRVLVMTRLTDLATVDKESLREAVAALLTELVRLSHGTDDADYHRIVSYAIEYGYEKQYGEKWHGNGPVRTALNDAALSCGEASHGVIADAVLALVQDSELATRAGWYFHDLRVLLQNLLINPGCGLEKAKALGDALNSVNAVSH
jgi:serine/threonine-protein kinase